VAPAIGAVLETLQAQPGAGVVRMSGSGATCFALFETVAARDEAAGRIRMTQPSWWQLASRIRE
jgi:4-diphosphocytidyl-2-C-methyl-D-erythritol kinase